MPYYIPPGEPKHVYFQGVGWYLDGATWSPEIPYCEEMVCLGRWTTGTGPAIPQSETSSTDDASTAGDEGEPADIVATAVLKRPRPATTALKKRGR